MSSHRQVKRFVLVYSPKTVLQNNHIRKRKQYSLWYEIRSFVRCFVTSSLNLHVGKSKRSGLFWRHNL